MTSSSQPGGDTSPAEVTNISRHCFWLLAAGEELFVPFDQFPWFKGLPIEQILNVEEPSPGHFYWPDPDVDLSRDIIRDPERFPLVSRGV